MITKIFSSNARLILKNIQRRGMMGFSALGMFSKYVYDFHEGHAGMKYELGGKGSNLCEMTNLGIPVPPGFVISVGACKKYAQFEHLPKKIIAEYMTHLRTLEKTMGKKLGDDKDPLLVSVRSGAAISMPGMMDTVLNLGLNDKSVLGLAKKTKNMRFALDSYRRFIQMFGDVVMNIENKNFEEVLTRIKKKQKIKTDDKLTVNDLKYLIS
jgi:pyruvate,orthophosphate dikinase